MLSGSKILDMISLVSCMRRNKLLTGFKWNNTFSAILKFSFCLDFQQFIAWGKGQSPSFGVLHSPYFQGQKWAGREQSLYVIWKTSRLSWGHSFHRLNFKETIISLKLEVLDDFKNLVRLDWKQTLIFRTLSEFQFFALHTLLEIDELPFISGKCLLNHWRSELNMLTNQICLS